MVKFWRKNAINIVLYLDDGLGINNYNFEQCREDSEYAKKSHVDAGFLLNEEK